MMPLSPIASLLHKLSRVFQRKRRLWMGLLVCLAAFLCQWILVCTYADSVMVSCSSPTVTAPFGGGTVIANVNCVINAPDADSAYQITGSANNFVNPGTLLLNKGLSLLLATRQSTVTSPDASVTSISGTSAGFTARVTSTPTPKTVRFQYSVTTTSSTPAGTYTSNLGSAYYQYRICTNGGCGKEVFNGMAPTSISVTVPSSPMTVSCASPSVTATPGGGPFTLSVICTASGGSSDNFTPSSQNIFSPTTITLTGQNHNINATLQPGVTSPDGSVSGISGTAGGGFTGTINSLPAKIQIQYAGTTTASTPAGTYTSTPVAYTWSTL